MTKPKIESMPVESADDFEGLMHCGCWCNKKFALCGVEMVEAGPRFPARPSEDDVCVVCLDLENAPCPRCGAIPL